MGLVKLSHFDLIYKEVICILSGRSYLRYFIDLRKHDKAIPVNFNRDKGFGIFKIFIDIYRKMFVLVTRYDEAISNHSLQR